MKTPITYYGGKQRLVGELLPMLPEHFLYVEAFAGGAALFFAKEPSKAEILNDISGEIENFYRVCKEDFESLKIRIDGTPHSRNAHREAMNIHKKPKKHSSLMRAWAFWVVTNQGFSGKIGSWALSRDNKMGRTLESKRQRFTKEYAERLKYTQLESNDALKIIQRSDKGTTFFYLDPPYFNSDCGHYRGYTEEDFKKLLEVLKNLKGKFLLSCYPSPILNEYIQKYGWKSKAISQKVNVSHKTKKEKTEMLIYNYEIPKFQKQENGLLVLPFEENTLYAAIP